MLEVPGLIPAQGKFFFFRLRTFCLSFIFIHVTVGTIATAFFNRQNSKFRLTHSLPDPNRKPRAQTKQRTPPFYATTLNKLTGGMCPLGFRRVCALSFLLSSIRLLVFFIQRNHIEALIFHINTFFQAA